MSDLEVSQKVQNQQQESSREKLGNNFGEGLKSFRETNNLELDKITPAQLKIKTNREEIKELLKDRSSDIDEQLKSIDQDIQNKLITKDQSTKLVESLKKEQELIKKVSEKLDSYEETKTQTIPTKQKSNKKVQPVTTSTKAKDDEIIKDLKAYKTTAILSATEEKNYNVKVLKERTEQADSKLNNIIQDTEGTVQSIEAAQSNESSKSKRIFGKVLGGIGTVVTRNETVGKAIEKGVGGSKKQTSFPTEIDGDKGLMNKNAEQNIIEQASVSINEKAVKEQELRASGKVEDLVASNTKVDEISKKQEELRSAIDEKNEGKIARIILDMKKSGEISSTDLVFGDKGEPNKNIEKQIEKDKKAQTEALNKIYAEALKDPTKYRDVIEFLKPQTEVGKKQFDFKDKNLSVVDRDKLLLEAIAKMGK